MSEELIYVPIPKAKWEQIRDLTIEITRLQTELAEARKDKELVQSALKPIYEQLCSLKVSHPHLVATAWLDNLDAAMKATPQ